jgi:hypothetical protein
MSLVEDPKVPGRHCGDCSLCCKLLKITELMKPEAKWCPHCAPGRGGCKIYDQRPGECQSFFCAWLTAPELGPEWRPKTAKMVLYVEGQGNRYALHVDPGFPDRWRTEPYFGWLKGLAMEAAEDQKQVVIYIKNRAIVLLPDREVDLGTFEEGDHLMVARTRAGEWTAYKTKAQDVPADHKGKWVRR